MQPVLSIVIVSYNTADLLPGCIESLLAQDAGPLQILVVDNASADESVDILLHRCYRDLELIVNQENMGFARACNQGLRQARADLVFFLNPDTMVQPGCCRAMLDFMSARPEVGLAGAAILDQDLQPHPSVEYTYPGHHYVEDELDGLAGEIAWLLGAALVGRTDLLRSLGGFDEDFFLYGEDIDLCLRMRKDGHPLAYIPQARVVHLEGQSERGAPAEDILVRKIRAELLFFAHHYRRRTIQRIVRARLLQAGWRLLTLRLALLLARPGESVEYKLVKYRVVWRMYLRCLRRDDWLGTEQ